MNQNAITLAMGLPMSGMTISNTDSNWVGDFQTSGGTTGVTFPSTTWDFWQNWYYPSVIRESYPVYIQERAMDKGQKAFEILKQLQDKKLMKMEKVSDFVEAMDALIKIL